MEPTDPIAKHYDIDLLAGEAAREEEAARIVNDLDKLFTPDSAPVSTGGTRTGLQYITHKVEQFAGKHLYSAFSSEMSKPYESFVHDGVNLVSRIIRLKTSETGPNDPTYTSASIYLIGLMGENQTNVTSANCAIGAMKTQSGQIAFFKIEKNTNKGKMIVSSALQDTESERMLAQQGRIDDDEIVVTELSPEERYTAGAEFEKALASLVNNSE